MILYPVFALLLLKVTSLSTLVPEGTTILFITFLATITPSASTITQMAQIYGQNAESAGGRQSPVMVVLQDKNIISKLGRINKQIFYQGLPPKIKLKVSDEQLPGTKKKHEYAEATQIKMLHPLPMNKREGKRQSAAYSS